MSLANGIDALAKYYKLKTILFWTKFYRCLVIILIRFSIWFNVMNIGLYNDIIYPSGKVSCILGSLYMILLDLYWFQLCIRKNYN